MKAILKKFFLSEKRTDDIVIVSGLPRCGTSMMMQMLEAGGIPPMTDHTRRADEDNPKGYYELERVKKLPDGDVFWLPDSKGKAVKVIAALLPYLPAEFEYDVLFMRRAMPEILASQRKMLERREEDADKVSDEEMTEHFNQHLKDVMAWAKRQQNIRFLEIKYNQLMTNPQPVFKRLAKFFGNQVNVEEMSKAIDPNLYRNRSEK